MVQQYFEARGRAQETTRKYRESEEALDKLEAEMFESQRLAREKLPAAIQEHMLNLVSNAGRITFSELKGNYMSASGEAALLFGEFYASPSRNELMVYVRELEREGKLRTALEEVEGKRIFVVYPVESLTPSPV